MASVSMHDGDVKFNIVEASIDDYLKALASKSITSAGLVTSYLNRIATYDICGGLNAFTVFNDNVLEAAVASDARRLQGLPPRPLEGIPYTIKDSYSVAGMTVTNGSPALAGLMSKEDSALAAKLRDAGAILIGKTNMPPMAAGGMQRGLYGRAESPYNPKYLTAAFSSGSSNGAATSIASSMAVFGLGSETVSSGRSPASNNALVCYTPSKGILSCRGLFPLYVTCDVPVPYARSVSDMLSILDVIATEDKETKGDFYRSQKHVPIPPVRKINYKALKTPNALQGKRIAIPKIYVGEKDSDPYAKPVYVSPEVITLWQKTEKHLRSLGAEVVHTDFPLVTNYENDSISGEANNVQNQPSDWNAIERGALIATSWNDFLLNNADPNIPKLSALKDSAMLFPKPESYVPDTFLEIRNWINYAGLPLLLSSLPYESLYDTPGLAQALHALEAQRKRDLDDWLDANNFDLIAFPAQGDVGLADLEFNLDSTKHSLQNGVKYSNGNRAIRHLGVPTVSVPMGVIEDKGMPVNITFMGRAYCDDELLGYAYAFEKMVQARVVPKGTPGLETDSVRGGSAKRKDAEIKIEASVYVKKSGNENVYTLDIHGTLSVTGEDFEIEIYVDGTVRSNLLCNTKDWAVKIEYSPVRPECLGWDLNSLPPRNAMVVITVKSNGIINGAKLILVDYNGRCR